MKGKGVLYVIPSGLGDGTQHTIPKHVTDAIKDLHVFVVENLRSARRYLRSIGYQGDFDKITMIELDKHAGKQDYSIFLNDTLNGEDTGLISEAGYPAVADPGAEIVHLAHQKGIQVIPLVGPSSILLALAASGLGGQQFSFNGYLPVRGAERIKAIKQLEERSARQKQTEIFMETPYRNDQMFDDLIQNCKPGTNLCIAADLTLETETVITKKIQDWKKETPKLHKRPAIFIIRS